MVTSPSSPSGATSAVLFLGTFDDKPYVPYLKEFFSGTPCFVVCEPVEMLAHMGMYCSKRNINAVVTTSIPILSRLLERLGNPRAKPSLADYAGSVFDYQGLEIVFVPPLKQLFTVSYGRFIAARYISKVTRKDTWPESTSFTFETLSERTVDDFYSRTQSAFATAIDIETTRTNLAIRCIGYTNIFIGPTGSITTESAVLPMDSTWALQWMRKLNSSPAQKIFQNGKYDCSYLLRYNAPPTNWQWDTAHFMHSWYSELPKDLAFLNAFFLRKVVYWKDLAETNDLQEYYRYNALDTWATANVWIQQLLQAPDWARKNYQLEFPLVYPCLLAEMTGLKRDPERLIAARTEIIEKESIMLTKLRNMIGVPSFNPGSPQQVAKLMQILGCGDLGGTGVQEMSKARLRHPLNELLLGMISRKKEEDGSSIRGLRKLKSNYLRTDEDAKQTGIHAGEGGAKELHGFILYALNPHGTDTGRLASREHHFWCGLQIQNIPRGKEVKQTICAVSSFYLGECDLEQAESRDTANISGDENLIKAVSGARDFHSVNAAAFFGVPYESIYDQALGKTKDKKLRDLAKRVNHGANYNMGPGVLIDTMGLDKIWEAGRLLKLPFSDPKKIAEHLLAQFHKTYPAIRRDYYASVINEIGISKRLVSRAFHHTGYNELTYDARTYIEEGDWTRYCFGKPDKSKSDLNSYVAHCPQSLNARTLNEAFLRVFYEIALPNPKSFRLHAQIHDSILFSYSDSDLPTRVKECMEIPVTVRDVSGTYRTFTVPAALKLGMKNKDGEFIKAKYWADTE